MASRKDNKGRVLREGEIQRKTDGRYMYRWTDARGKRQTVYADTLNELRQKEQEISMEQFHGIARKNITLNKQIEIYLKTKVSLQNSTKENYHYYYDHAIKDSFLGGMQIIDIQKSDILMFYKEKYDSGYKRGSLQILHKIIHPALELAVDDRIIFKNPSKGCLKEYADDSDKKYALTLDEEKEFLDRILSKPRIRRYYPFYAILLNTGMRISEAVGLTWNDVDMEEREISINHQLLFRKKDGRMQFYCTEGTKTDSGVRIIPMTEKVYDLFRQQRKEWFRIERDVKYKVDGYCDFVFLSHCSGRPFYHGNVRKQIDRIVAMNNEREVQLPKISPHILRHTFCTRVAEADVDIKTLQYLMGHSDLKTTMQIYNHVDLERAKRAMSKIEEWRESHIV